MEENTNLAVQVPPLRCMTMEKRKKVIAFFRELGFEFNISRFDDRLIAQKLVCLLESGALISDTPAACMFGDPTLRT